MWEEGSSCREVAVGQTGRPCGRGEAKGIRRLKHGESRRLGVECRLHSPSPDQKTQCCLWQEPSLEVSRVQDPCLCLQRKSWLRAKGSGFPKACPRSFWTPCSCEGRTLVRALGPQLQGPPLTADRRCTARPRSARPVHRLPRRRAAPVPPGNLALRGSCHGRWTKSRQVGTRCQPHKGVRRSLRQEGAIRLSAWSPPTPPCTVVPWH